MNEERKRKIHKILDSRFQNCVYAAENNEERKRPMSAERVERKRRMSL
jgi:hypothetical protein